MQSRFRSGHKLLASLDKLSTAKGESRSKNQVFWQAKGKKQGLPLKDKPSRVKCFGPDSLYWISLFSMAMSRLTLRN